MLLVYHLKSNIIDNTFLIMVSLYFGYYKGTGPTQIHSLFDIILGEI